MSTIPYTSFIGIKSNVQAKLKFLHFFLVAYSYSIQTPNEHNFKSELLVRPSTTVHDSPTPTLEPSAADHPTH